MDVGKVISQSEKSYQTEQNFLQRKALTLLKYKISQIKIEKWGVGLGMAKQLVNINKRSANHNDYSQKPINPQEAL